MKRDKSVSIYILDELYYNTSASSRAGISGEIVSLDRTQLLSNVIGSGELDKKIFHREDTGLVPLVDLKPGEHTLTYKVFDIAGRQAETKATFFIKDLR